MRTLRIPPGRATVARRLRLLALVCVVVACGDGTLDDDDSTAPGDDDSSSCDPDRDHIDEAALVDALAWLDSNPTWQDSMLVQHCGERYVEQYWGGYDATTPHDLQSATKTFSATLIGVAIDQGLIDGVAQQEHGEGSAGRGEGSAHRSRTGQPARRHPPGGATSGCRATLAPADRPRPRRTPPQLVGEPDRRTTMRIHLLLPLLAVLVTPLLVPASAAAHCQIPCGIYDDELRALQLREHIGTIEKSMRMIRELSAAQESDENQLVRWVENKEDHADAIVEIVTAYFLSQRIKLPAEGDEASQAAYRDRLALLHGLLVHTMKARQSTDQAVIDELRRLAAAFEVEYFGHEVGAR